MAVHRVGYGALEAKLLASVMLLVAVLAITLAQPSPQLTSPPEAGIAVSPASQLVPPRPLTATELTPLPAYTPPPAETTVTATPTPKPKSASSKQPGFDEILRLLLANR